MRYDIAHWYGNQPPVPTAIKVTEGDEKHSPSYEIEIDDIHKFVEDHGPIILKPRNGRFFIWVTTGGSFSQM